jgi:hypothetical protein
MAATLDPELAIAYVRELSADVRAAVVLGAEGDHLAGPAALADPARALAAALEAGVVRTAEATVFVARGRERTLVAVAGPAALAGPTGLDAAAAVGAPQPPAVIARPAPALLAAVESVIAAT